MFDTEYFCYRNVQVVLRKQLNMSAIKYSTNQDIIKTEMTQKLGD